MLTKNITSSMYNQSHGHHHMKNDARMGLPPLKSHTVGGINEISNGIGALKVQQLYDEGVDDKRKGQSKNIGSGSVRRPSLPSVKEPQLKDALYNQNQQYTSPSNRRNSYQRKGTAGTTDNSVPSSAKSKSQQQNYLSPEQAMKQHMHKLTSYEHHEIFSYQQIFYTGPSAKKRQGVVGGANNNGFDDDQGSYIPVAHDHIVYRYEVLKVIGKGSFGQVINCLETIKAININK